ncbi:MAG: MATE family efflux transporter [Odoribacter sp.]|nr:MATE family efflux transporter [Odoribacter sp.]
MVQNPQVLETESIGKLLLQYSVPAIIAMTVTSVYNVIDSAFIGHGVGPLAISGLALTFPLMNLMIAFCTLIGVGGASVSSIYLGQKDNQKATEVLHNVFLLSLIAGFCFGGLSLYFLDDILIFFGASNETLPYARSFMQVLLLANPISFLFISLNNVLRATGYPRKAMLSSLLTVGMNIILASVFIFYLEWGIQGAAMATVLAQICGLAWVLNHFLKTSSFIHLQKGGYQFKRHVIASILSIGMAPFLLHVCASIIVVILNHSFKIYGGDLAIGAYGIVNRVATLFVMVIIGLTQGMQPIVGYNFGARHFDRVNQTLRKVIFVAVALMSVGWLMSEWFPARIVALFSDDPELNELAEAGLRITILAFPMVGAQIVITNFFQSVGKAKISILLSLARQVLFLIPLLCILPHVGRLGIHGVWGSIPVSDTLAFISAAFTLKWYLRKMKCMFP